MSAIEKIHGGYVYGRRISTLTAHLAKFFPQEATVLDVGCGDGLLARRIMDQRPDVNIRGIDVLLRPKTHIPVTTFDGTKIPWPDASFDVVLFVDVLHHTVDPNILLAEATRVTRKYLLIKDHTVKGIGARARLRFMDWVGNARHGVVLPYNYWTRPQWIGAFDRLGLGVEVWKRRLNLYPIPADWVFGASLHMITRVCRNPSHEPPRESSRG